ncbi:hypothetical protein JCM11641_005529 [Rhodosporidiobolus odoratus]
MTATTTARTKPKLLYTLQTRPPIPFLPRPTYPIRTPPRDLATAYSDALWPQADSKQPHQAILESFARLLIHVLAEQAPAAFNALARGLLLPLQDFDKRWRDHVPTILEKDDETGKIAVNASEPSALEQSRFREDYARWEKRETVRLEEERAARKSKMTKGKGKERAMDEDGGSQVDGESTQEQEPVQPHSGDWLAEKELFETRLQALLLLALLSLPATFQPELPKKGRKKKNPEKYAETLDPAMLLDFLTDRLQIWRVMKDVSDLDVTTLGDSREGEASEKVKAEVQPDAVQEWWQGIVEPLFRTLVDSSVLSHHRLKLFPAPSQAERVAQRLAPAPSPFKTRSLLSLERSARRRQSQDESTQVAASPTMKRLMSRSSLSRVGVPLKAVDRGDIFKIPNKPSGRAESGVDDSPESGVDDPTTADKDVGMSEQHTARRPRKQERPRPLPRGDSSTAARQLLQRREVSLGRKPVPSAVGLQKKPGTGGTIGGSKDGGEGRERKRKAANPRKLSPEDRDLPTLTLVPDTPSKTAARAATGRKSFARAPSVPSLAALGAAFRAGASETFPPPFSFGPAPVSGNHRKQPTRDTTAHSAMDVENAEVDGDDQHEDDWLDGREADWHSKGGRDRQSSYNGDEEEIQPTTMAASTPQKSQRAMLVPDT